MKEILNSDRFLTLFNQLEHHFKNQSNNGYWKSFKQMLKDESRTNPVVNRFKEDLFEMADLRNAIVHNRANDFKVIAEPHTFIVDQLDEIVKNIMFPEKLDRFLKKVITCKLNDPVELVVDLFYQHQISQIPVVNQQNQVVEILNSNNIAYWLSKNEFDLKRENSVEYCIALKEYKQNYAIIAEHTTIYNAAEMYRQSYQSNNKHKYYDALLITKHGQKHEPLIGIIVLSDIAQYI